MITVRVPIRLESEANGSHGHWSVKAKRAKAIRQAVTCAFIDSGVQVQAVVITPKKLGGKVRRCARWKSPPAFPLVVFLARIAPRQLDDDNLARSAKAVRDQVAELLGVDDRDPRVTWRYDQWRGNPNEYAVDIGIAPRGELQP